MGQKISSRLRLKLLNNSRQVFFTKEHTYPLLHLNGVKDKIEHQFTFPAASSEAMSVSVSSLGGAALHPAGVCYTSGPAPATERDGCSRTQQNPTDCTQETEETCTPYQEPAT